MSMKYIMDFQRLKEIYVEEKNIYDFIHKPTWTCITKKKDKLISNLPTVLHNVFDKDLIINNNNNNNNFIFYFFFIFSPQNIQERKIYNNSTDNHRGAGCPK